LLEHRFIPEKTFCTQKKKPIWLTHKALKAVGRKRQVYRKYKDATHPAYIRACKEARVLTRKAKKQFEHKLASKIKEDRKSFFAYVRSKRKSKVNVSPLVDSNGELVSESKAKAEMLNDFFSSVFTKELDAVPAASNRINDAKLVDVAVNATLIRNKLCNLKEDKAAGNDDMSPRILKAISDSIAVPIGYRTNTVGLENC